MDYNLRWAGVLSWLWGATVIGNDVASEDRGQLKLVCSVWKPCFPHLEDERSGRRFSTYCGFSKFGLAASVSCLIPTWL